MDKLSDLSVVTVAYGSFGCLPQMADSLPSGVELTIVDNGPDDGLRDWAKTRNIRVIVPGENLGFGRACNLGAVATDHKLILFLNPDTLVGLGAIDALLAAAQAHPKVSAFGPMLIDEDGNPALKRRSRFDNTRRILPKDRPTGDVLAPVLSGSAMLVRRTCFEKVGGFDENIFLYYEDDDLSLRLRDQCGPLMVIPAAIVRHAGGQSTAPTAATERWKGRHWQRSQLYVARKFGKRRVFLRGLISVLGQMLKPRTWLNPQRRHHLLGRLQGLFASN